MDGVYYIMDPENHFKMNDLGVPLFLEKSIYFPSNERCNYLLIWCSSQPWQLYLSNWYRMVQWRNAAMALHRLYHLFHFEYARLGQGQGHNHLRGEDQS